MTVSFRITGIPNLMQARARLAGLEGALKNRHVPLLDATKAVAFAWDVNFGTEGSRVGGWAELSARSLAERSAQGYGPGPILRRSGTLHDSAIANFTSASGPFTNSAANPYRSGSAAAIFTQLSLSDDRASLALGGTAATTHQHGSAAKNIPARPIWYVDDEVRHTARGAVEMWLKEIIKEHMV